MEPVVVQRARAAAAGTNGTSVGGTPLAATGGAGVGSGGLAQVGGNTLPAAVSALGQRGSRRGERRYPSTARRLESTPIGRSMWSTDTTCMAVFTDGAGCAAVCAEAGLDCAEVWENTDDQCAADTGLAELSCDPDTGHQSDYCVCAGEGTPAGSGGAPASGGAGSGGAGSGGAGPAAPSTAAALGGQRERPVMFPDYIFSKPAPIGWASEEWRHDRWRLRHAILRDVAALTVPGRGQ